jgi:hypothetical protein
MNDFDTEALWCTVHDFYREKYSTLELIIEAAQGKGLFNGEHVTLWRVLRKMGFKHKKTMIRATYMHNWTPHNSSSTRVFEAKQKGRTTSDIFRWDVGKCSWQCWEDVGGGWPESCWWH